MEKDYYWAKDRNTGEIEVVQVIRFKGSTEINIWIIGSETRFKTSEFELLKIIEPYKGD